ncbi:MAG: AtpZ/AtpI family protein [Candidatus Paceibacterota bacterium]
MDEIEKEEIKNKDNNLFKQGGPWWKPSLQIFSEISTWIAFPAILAVVLGKALDERYSTGNLILILFTVIAFVVSAYGIVKAVRKFSAKLKREEEKK